MGEHSRVPPRRQRSSRREPPRPPAIRLLGSSDSDVAGLHPNSRQAKLDRAAGRDSALWNAPAENARRLAAKAAKAGEKIRLLDSFGGPGPAYVPPPVEPESWSSSAMRRVRTSAPTCGRALLLSVLVMALVSVALHPEVLSVGHVIIARAVKNAVEARSASTADGVPGVRSAETSTPRAADAPSGTSPGDRLAPRRGPIARARPSDDPLDGIDADARCVRLTATGGESVGLAAEALALVHASRRVREGGRSVVWDFSAASATCPCQDEDPLDPLDPLDDDEEDYPGARGARRLLLAQNKNPTPTRAKATAKAKAKAKAKATTTAAAATPPSLCAAGNLHPDARNPGWSALFDSSTVAPPSRERALARGDRKSSSGTSSRVSAWLGAVARVVGLGARRTPSSRRASTSTTPTPSSTSRTHPSSTRPSRGSAGPATAAPPPPPSPPTMRASRLPRVKSPRPGSSERSRALGGGRPRGFRVRGRARGVAAFPRDGRGGGRGGAPRARRRRRRRDGTSRRDAPRGVPRGRRRANERGGFGFGFGFVRGVPRGRRQGGAEGGGDDAGGEPSGADAREGAERRASRGERGERAGGGGGREG